MGKLGVNVEIWEYWSCGSIDGRNKKLDVNYCKINNYNNKKGRKREWKKKDYNYKENVKDLEKLMGGKIEGMVGKERLRKLGSLYGCIRWKRIVECMEKFLKDEDGFRLGGYGCDGCFGGCREKGVKKFEKCKKLKVDGIVGDNRWKGLRKRGWLNGKKEKNKLWWFIGC